MSIPAIASLMPTYNASVPDRGIPSRPMTLHDCAPRPADFGQEVLAGLRQSPKTLPCKFFYDSRGSQLFDRICELDEYYLTRTEAKIMCRHGHEMAARIGSDALIIEYGSGSSTKTRILLDQLDTPAAYMPIDISRAHLIYSSLELAHEYPGLQVLPVCADYTTDFTLPEPDNYVARRVVYFPGSTIGNFEPEAAAAFLKHVAGVCGRGGALLIGVDLHKDSAILEPAYNDARGVTADFNLNLLHRINAELGADFDLDNFRHHAFYDQKHGRIEMHLISRGAQTVHIAGEHIAFHQDESIVTEYSHKYSLDGFARLAASAGFRVEKVWMDERRLFSVQYLVGGG